MIKVVSQSESLFLQHHSGYTRENTYHCNPLNEIFLRNTFSNKGGGVNFDFQTFSVPLLNKTQCHYVALVKIDTSVQNSRP